MESALPADRLSSAALRLRHFQVLIIPAAVDGPEGHAVF